MLIDNGGRKVFVRRNTFFLLLILLATAVLRIVEIIRLPSIWHRDEIFSVVYALNSFGDDLNPHDSIKPRLHYYLLAVALEIAYLLRTASESLELFSHSPISYYFWEYDFSLLIAKPINNRFGLGTWCPAYRIAKGRVVWSCFIARLFTSAC